MEYWTTGGETPDGRSAEAYEQEGVLLIGVGKGRFDEHPSVNSERKQEECATTLVVKALGVEDDPALEKILQFVLNNDLRAAAHPFDIAYLTGLLHQCHPSNPEKVTEWTMEGLEAKYWEQLRFHTVAREEFERNAEVEEVVGPGDRTLRMVTIVSDNEQMNKFARSVHGGEAAIIIQKRSSGNVQLFNNQKYGLVLYDVAQMLRLAEQEAKSNIMTTDWKLLASEGKVEGAEEWFYHHKGQMLLNGSLTAKGVPPTRLSLKQIKEIVRIGINPDTFEPSRTPDCQQGVCTAKRSNPCPWYNWGLHRCRKIRYAMSQTSSQI